MDDDFNTPVALSVLFELAADVHRGVAGAREQLRALASVLGLLGRAPQAVRRSGLGGSEAGAAGASDSVLIESLIAERAAAKKAKRYQDADRIRAELLAQGVVLEDTPAGTSWRRA